MKSVEVFEQSPNLAELVEMARKENGLVLLESGRPIAQVIPLPGPSAPRITPLHPGAIEAGEDFDAPLPDDFWLGNAGQP
jgi:antitoxin (DNA-binding transcriptional repressor) of toxin-antitoxin stability system